MSQRAFSRVVLALFVGLLLGAVASPGRSAPAAGKPAISVGDITVSTDAGAAGDTGPELGRALRAALHDELGRVPGLAGLKRPLILSATLTRLSSERADDRAKAHATISLAVRRADDQVLFAELRGDARVERASESLVSLRRAAVQSAVHGALARLPEVVQRSR